LHGAAQPITIIFQILAKFLFHVFSYLGQSCSRKFTKIRKVSLKFLPRFSKQVLVSPKYLFTPKFLPKYVKDKREKKAA
jgi:hypothetical protein